MTDIYQHGLDKAPANYQPLTPITFLSRTAQVFPDRVAIIHGESRFTYAEYFLNVRKLASALIGRGVRPGDTVSILAANIPPFLDASFAIPMTGAVLNPLNTRLDAEGLAFILDHAECKVLLVDTAFASVVREALLLAETSPLVVDILDQMSGAIERVGEVEYQELLAEGDGNFSWDQPTDEWQAVALNYTSGTTGNPKGAVYAHRGAYLNALGNTLAWPMGDMPVYLWTLPMFHCNGWCFPWTIAAVAGTHVCLRSVEVEGMVNSMAKHGVTHFCGAPIILNMIVHAPENLQKQLPRGVRVLTGGAPPPATVIQVLESLGFDVTHAYGLTEVYGPAVISQWNEEWDELSADEKAKLKARQGVRYHTQEHVDVLDPQTMIPVPADASTVGEIMFRGNTTMRGYLKNRNATEEAFSGGWFHSGDLAVMHPDGYIEICDRSKDIIISGGENISSVEIEGVLHRHPFVVEAAVVAKPHAKWGETPCAFVLLKENQEVPSGEIIQFCRNHLAHFKCPTSVVFGEIPKTSTGKVQKYLLREQARRITP